MELSPEEQSMLAEKYKSYSVPQDGFLEQVAEMPREQAAKIMRLAVAANIDTAEAARNPNATIRTLIGASDFEDVGKTSPKTYSFLSDPLHMAIVRDAPSVKTLSTLETIASPFTFLKSGTQKVGKSMVDALKGVVETATALDQRSQQETGDSTLYNIAKRFSFLGAISGAEKVKFLDDLSKTEALTPKEYNFKGQKFSILGQEYDTAQLVANIYEGIPQLASQVVARMAGGPLASGAAIGAQIFGSGYDDLRKQGVAPERAFTGAAGSAIAQAALETLSLEKILGKIPATATGRQKARAIIEAASSEAATEFLQQYPQALATIWGTNSQMSLPEMKDEFVRQFRQITSEGLYSALVAAPLGGGAGAINASVRTRLMKAQIRQLEERQAVISKSPLLKVSPEALEAFENANGNPDTVYIDPKALLQTELPDITEKLGVTEEALQEALSTGTNVEVPIGKYNVAASQEPAIHQALKEDIAFASDERTVRQEKEWTERDLAGEVQKVDIQRNEVRQAGEEIVKQWVNAGIPPQVAREMLIALKSHAASVSDDPAKFLRSKAPMIRRVGNAAGSMKQYAGLSAYTADKSQLQTAKELDSKSVNPEEIRKQTGWFKGMDGKWRFEIDDSQAKMIDLAGIETDIGKQVSSIMSKARKVKDVSEKTKLTDQADTLISELSQKKAPFLGKVLDHPQLYQAYPWMRDIKVVFSQMPEGTNGGYDSAINTIEINQSLNPEQKKKTIMHEVQHVLQEQENFARGGNPNQFQEGEGVSAYEQYRKLAGEIEARNTADRYGLTSDQRQEIAPDLQSDAIVVFGGKERLYQYSDTVGNNIAQGKQAMEQVISEHTDVLNAMYREDLGGVSFYWGIPGKGKKFKGGSGVSHIVAKRDAEDGSGQATALKLVEVIAKGNVIQRQEQDQGSRVLIAYDGYTAVLSLYKDGELQTWLLTGWKNNEEAPNATGKVYDLPGATSSEPTRFQSGEADASANISIPKPGELFQSQNDPKGSIHWENGKAIITLFEKSDPSTLIHEMFGHFFIQNLIDAGSREDAPQQVKKDRKTALEFAGVENWENATEEERREAHEKLARAAEAYMMEGKSPSKETRSLFKRFAEWLTDIYRDVVNLRIQLNPEIREVFDRLLATEEEIDRMAAVDGYLSRVPENIYNSLTDSQKAELDRRLDNTRERAEAQVRAQLLLEFTEENKLKIAAEEKTARESITKEVMEQPLYKAETAIEEAFNRKAKRVARAYIGNTPFVPEDMDTAMGPLDALEAVYASMVQRGAGNTKAALDVKRQIDEMQAGKGKKVKELSVDQQMEFEYIAELHGFTSGSELAQHIMAYNTSEKTIDNRLEDHLNAFKEKLSDSIALHKSVQDAMYSDEGALLIAAEQGIIEEQLGKVISRESSRQETKRRFEAARLQVQEVLGNIPLEKVIRLDTWISAERRAAESKTRALQRKDLERAREAASQQLFNHVMVQESQKIRQDYERIIRYFKKQRTAGMDTWIKEEHFLQAAYILARMDFVRKDFDSKKRVENLAEWAKRMNDHMDNVEIPDWLLLNGEATSPRSLTYAKLQEVENTLRNIKKVAQMENRFFVIQQGEEIGSVLDRMEEKLTGMKDVYVPKPEEGKYDRYKGNLRKFLRSSEKFSTLVQRLDGFKDFGFFHELLYDPVYRQQNKMSQIITELKRKEQETTNRLYSKEEQIALYKPVFFPELGVSVSRRYLLEMASHVGTKSNMDALFGKPPVGLENSSLWVKEDSGRVNPDATSNLVMPFLMKHLEQRDWEWVQAGWDNINSLWPEAAEMHRQQTGFSMKKVEALSYSVDLPDGTEYQLRGGYYPLKEDRRARSIAEQRDAESRPLYTEHLQLYMPKTNTGYTHARTGVAYSVDLNPMNRYRHMQAVAHDIAFRPVITDLRRLITNDRFKGLMERKVGPEGYAAIRDFVAAAATPKTEASTTGQQILDTVANTMRERMIIATMMFNVKTLLQNFANPFLYGNAVEGFSHQDAVRAFFNRGVFEYWAKGATNREAFRQDREFVLEKSAFMRDKLETPDFSLSEFQKQMKGEESKIVRWGSMLMAETDNLTNVPMWMEAYHKKIDAGVSEYEAVRFADTLIDRATGSGRKIDTAPLLRGNAVTRLFTMFQTFMNTQYNAWSREYGIYMKEKDAARLTAFVASRWWMFAAASLLLGGGAPDKDDDDFVAKWAYEMLAYPINLVPVVGSAASTALAYTLGVQSFGYRMVSVESQVDKLTKVFSTARGVIEGKRTPQDLAEGLSSSAAFVVPYPDQFNKWFWNGVDVLFNDVAPEGGDLVRRRPRKERQ